MVILRIVFVGSFTHEPHEEVSIDPFVVVQWHEAQIIKTKNGGNDEDRDGAIYPDTVGNVVGSDTLIRTARIDSLGGMSLNAMLLT